MVDVKRISLLQQNFFVSLRSKANKALLCFACVLALFLFSATVAHAQCANPAGSEGDVIYNSSYDVPQYCDGANNWIAMVGADSSVSLGCPNIGDSCNDGSLFAGDTNLYVTNVNQNTNTQWNASVGNNDINPDSTSDGQANHDNATVALSNLLAINICETLDLHGHQDWYLPARDELDQLYQNKAAIDTNAAEAFTAFDYWSSSEVTTLDVWIQRFSDGFQDNAFGKDNYGDVRCVRREMSSQITQIVPSGLVAHWRLDETSGTDVIDYASANNGAMVNMDGAANGTTGVVGGALDFNNLSDVIDIPTFNLSGPAATFSAWVYMRSLPGDSRIITKADGTALDSHDWAVLIEENGGFLKARIKTTGTTQESDTDGFFVMPANKWTHVTFVYDSAQANEFAWYVNGQLVNTENHVDGGNIATSTKPVALGNKSSLHGGGSRELDGKLDDVRVYDRALTAEEVQEVYAARDGVRYNQSFRTPEFFDGNKWVAMRRGFREVDTGAIYQYTGETGCASVGALCGDGSYYAGTTPDGDVDMYVASAASETNLTWDNTATVLTGITSTTDGDGNTTDLVGLGANYLAANYCNDLTAHGKSDWYLPAEDELALLYNGGAPIASVLADGSYYWSSTETNGDSTRARGVNFSFGSATSTAKGNALYVRCVRQAPKSVAGTGGLMGHWKLDETSGTTVVDSSGNGNNGTMLNGLTGEDSIEGAVGRGIEFDPIEGDVISIPYAADFAFNGLLTISTWLKANPLNNINMIMNSGPASSQLEILSGNLQFKLNGGSNSAAVAFSPEDNRWYHLVVTFDDATDAVRYYIDGAFYGSGSTADVFSGTPNIVLGRGDSRRVRALDDFRLYNRILSDTEIQSLYAMGAPVGQTTALPQGCPNIGDVCDDGTVYTGLSPDGNVAMYATPNDAPSYFLWNSGSINYTATSAISAIDGDANTNAIVVTDSDSVTAGFQTHQSAQYCYDLVAHGADDWYLPAQNELNVLYTNRSEIGNFDEAGGEYGGSWYWSSTEVNSNDVVLQRFEDGTTAGWNKHHTDKSTRCVRKGPAPRCANPYGREGDMFYNTTHDVVQYCDGARWIGVGKDG